MPVGDRQHFPKDFDAKGVSLGQTPVTPALDLGGSVALSGDRRRAEGVSPFAVSSAPLIEDLAVIY
ncbi:hypothetical protein [Plantactinospora sp. KBS50]|uniref:hypothetical protein n=1 Tax=Plantactinospora sp. KBS50 TaxID=2024580 RepID=UPI0012FD92F6|nr:hypothetical protein [Plantactinospora sp. KBS50]